MVRYASLLPHLYSGHFGFLGTDTLLNDNISTRSESLCNSYSQKYNCYCTPLHLYSRRCAGTTREQITYLLTGYLLEFL